MTQNEDRFRDMIELLNQTLDLTNKRKGTNYTQYKMPADVWGKFVDKYNGPDVIFAMANTYSTNEGVMFGIYENEKLASVARGSTYKPSGSHILRKKSKKKIFAEGTIKILKLTSFILSILSILIFIGTVFAYFLNDNFRNFISFEWFATIIITTFFGSGFFIFFTKKLDEIY
ncbi:hypothetical protein ACPV3A_29685 [Paenibacillus sp. Dod16]|uniref:hypothetical protein n=1 Tax=Paenibacillus sp. Dod16 TaxID=3416392 RepID=UPI003CFA74E6